MRCFELSVTGRGIQLRDTPIRRYMFPTEAVEGRRLEPFTVSSFFIEVKLALKLQSVNNISSNTSSTDK